MYTKKPLNINPFAKATHCVFDLDGTLLDTERLYHDVIREFCEQHDRDYTKEFELLMCGKSDNVTFEIVHRELRITMSLKEFKNILTNLSKERLSTARFMPGVEKLVKHLYKCNIPLAIATNSTQEQVDTYITARPDFFSMFHHIITITDPNVTQGKPHPQMYLLAASRFDEEPEPRKCLAFEDSPTGLYSASDAGMQVVFIPYAGILRQDCKLKRKATMMLKSLEEFKPEAMGLPPYTATKNVNPY